MKRLRSSVHLSVVLATFRMFKRCFGRHSSRMEPWKIDFRELQMETWKPRVFFCLIVSFCYYYYFLRIGELHGEIYSLWEDQGLVFRFPSNWGKIVVFLHWMFVHLKKSGSLLGLQWLKWWVYKMYPGDFA